MSELLKTKPKKKNLNYLRIYLHKITNSARDVRIKNIHTKIEHLK